jgi:dihydrofolate synthase / folylpolyglutamate synthase
MPESRAGIDDLAGWLNRVERLHPSTIALGLERVRPVARRLALEFDCQVITVGGTNGKGSTCAMLESVLLAASYRVGAYTKPHLLRFNERARINGVPAGDEMLLPLFEEVERARGDTALTYFEFTTLVILLLFQRASLDVAILEVGLGGRLDAVNLIDADCSIVTSVDIDHTDYLGDTREKIGWEKAHIYRAGRPAICSDPVPPRSLVDYAGEIGADLWLFGRDFNYSGDRQQWSYGGREQRRNSLAYPALRGTNQLLNASGALAALEALRAELPVSQQAVRQGLATIELPGRFQVLAGRPTVVLDVAHNPHAAAHLAGNLGSMGFFPYTWAVFGMLRDKDIDAVIDHLKSRIDHWLLADLPGPRGIRGAEIIERLERAGVVSGPEHHVEAFGSPLAAYRAALAAAGENDRIVVFGSFFTVSDVLASRMHGGASA